MIRTIFFDLDGTLIDCMKGWSSLSGYTLEVFAKLRRRGLRLIVATGRSASMLPPSVRDFGFDGYVLANGASVWAGKKEVSRHVLPEELAGGLVGRLERENLEYALQLPGGTYLSENRQGILPYFKRHLFEEAFLVDGPLRECLAEILKIEAYVPGRAREDIVRLFHPLACDCPPDGHTVEAAPAQVTKASGARELLAFLGASMKETMCFGDAQNDLELFAGAGWAVAMENACAQVQEQAEAVCKSVKEDGVARYLEKYFA